MDAASLARVSSDIKQLEGSVLSVVTQDAENKIVLLRFKHWEDRSISLECRRVIHCNVSVDDPSGDSEVIGASLRNVDTGILDHLDKYGYLWTLNSEEARWQNDPWVHLSIDGDTCLAIVCGEVGFV